MSIRMKLVGLAQQVTPPGLLWLAKRTVYPWGFRGDYASWQESCRAAGAGYLDPRIADHVLEGTKASIDEWRQSAGRASAATLRLLGAALDALWDAGDREAHILDFGGALGTHYFALRPLLPESLKVRWTVCETEPMCDAGSRNFANDELSFVSSLESVPSASLAVASGSLQYLEHPIATFRELADRAPYVFVDRLPLTARSKDRLTLQKVPPWLYRSACPAWFLSADTWQREIDGRLVYSWDSDERWQLGGEKVPLRGFLVRTQP